jgi:hypothetical protein
LLASSKGKPDSLKISFALNSAIAARFSLFTHAVARLFNNLELVTENVGDFPGVETVNPLKP